MASWNGLLYVYLGKRLSIGLWSPGDREGRISHFKVVFCAVVPTYVVHTHGVHVEVRGQPQVSFFRSCLASVCLVLFLCLGAGDQPQKRSGSPI